MENNEQNNIEATNNVNPVNNVEPTPEVKTEDTIMVAEPAARPVSTPTPAVQPTPAPVVQPQELAAQQPVAPVEPTVAAEPVVIPKGEKPKSNNGIIAFLILIIMILGICGYFVYDKYIKGEKPTTPNTNEPTNNNQQTNNNEPEPTPVVENEDENFGEKLVVKNQKLGFEDSKTRQYTYDIYLGDNLVVGNLTYNEIAVETSVDIALTKVGYLKDIVTGAKYYAFSVKNAPRAMANTTVFIIDKDGKVVLQKEGRTDGQYEIKETGEYVGGTTYKVDETENRLFYYVISGAEATGNLRIEVKSIQISSGSPVDTEYKTYTYNNSNNSNEPTPVSNSGLTDDEMLIGDDSIGQKIVVKNKQIISEDATKGGKRYTYDLYLDDKLVAKNLEYYESEGYNSEGKILQDYHKLGIIKDAVTDAKYFAFKLYAAPTKYSKITLFIIDKDGNIVFQRTSETDGAYTIKATGEFVHATAYKIDDDTNTMYYYDIPDSSLIKIEKKSVQISSGTVVDTLVETFTKDDFN